MLFFSRMVRVQTQGSGSETRHCLLGFRSGRIVGAPKKEFSFHNWVVTLEAVAEWEARQTQVSMVELLATVSVLDLIAILWDVVTFWDVALFVWRVPTDSNPSNGAGRARFESLESRGACWVKYRSFALCAQQGALARGASAQGMWK